MESSAVDAPNYSTNLRERVSSMFEAGRWTDCKFLVGTENQDLMEGHKAILASASPVFDAMFFGEMAESKNPILIPDIKPATFKAILKYIYTDDIKISSLDEAFNIYYAGNKYILPNLEKICVTYIESNLSPTNVCQAYEFASLFQEGILMTKCYNIMRSQTNDVLSETRLDDVQLSTLVKIYSLEHINCTALDMFNTLERYLKVQKRHRNNDIDPYDDIEPLNLWSECSSQSLDSWSESLEEDERAVPPQPSEFKKEPEIRTALEKIPFLTLTAQQFAEGPARSDLLTQSEMLAIFMNIASDKTNTPMPSGFSTHRRKRELAVCQRCGDGHFA